ncbi:hypothetical protein [Bradyrhizobium sp. Ash2021]|uniref:hypothetical protein n=1 Tax=Bradyrhizobium sp. Ash2021 TaxID=2954771 RepID=UPI0028165B83|nr:hypothetical protein [Bradyrhizobium sp. Ash2021]WMT76466.1 hypothetical protein NL528_08930 [Bradyrhizobium sp. Ash2021]
MDERISVPLGSHLNEQIARLVAERIHLGIDDGAHFGLCRAQGGYCRGLYPAPSKPMPRKIPDRQSLQLAEM